MHAFLVRATPLAAPHSRAQAIFGWVARGSAETAEGVMLGALHRAGWKVLEVYDPGVIQARLPGLKRHPQMAQAMASARTQGLAFLVMDPET